MASIDSADDDMASKRNSRVFVGTSMDDSLPLAQDMEAQRNRALPRDAAAASRSRSTSSGGRETTAAGPSGRKSGDGKATPPLKVSLPTRPSDYPAALLDGRPLNFGVVVPGVYRSSYPRPDDYAFLQSLRLKTVVTLAKKDELDHHLESFITTNGIRQVIFNMKGTKKETIPVDTMTSILRLVLDPHNYPLLVHCNHGKHRTGCVVAVVRKLSGWHLHKVVDEYKAYAAPKIRECDMDYISSFQSSSIQSFSCEPPRFNPVQVRSFFRTLLFSTLIMMLWLVSGSKMFSSRDHFAA